MAYCDCAPGDGSPGLVGRKISNISDEEGDWSGHNSHSLAESTRCSSDSDLSMGNYPSVVHTPRSTCAEEGYAPAPGIRYTKREPLVEMDGNLFPPFWRSSEVQILQNKWAAREGDVFVVSQFPIWGLARLLVALVEGGSDPWRDGLLEPIHFLDCMASMGARTFMDEAAKRQGRRFFKSYCIPSAFPCKYPFEENAKGQGPSPKIVVLVADPRHVITTMWTFFTKSKCHFFDGSLTDFIRWVASGKFRIFGEFFQHAVSWAREAAEHPEYIQLFDAGRLGSLDPKEVRAELENIADFLDIPRERAAELVAATFRRPAGAAEALAKDACSLPSIVEGDHLLEQTGRNLNCFENSLNNAAAEVHELWHTALKVWVTSSSSQLVQLARVSMKGMSSTPPLMLTISMKGMRAHEAGTCRPCVFALRGICKNTAEMCLYCHADGHSKTKRASQKMRQVRKAKQDEERIRTPSPSPRNVQLQPLSTRPFLLDLPPWCLASAMQG